MGPRWWGGHQLNPKNEKKAEQSFSTFRFLFAISSRVFCSRIISNKALFFVFIPFYLSKSKTKFPSGTCSKNLLNFLCFSSFTMGNSQQFLMPCSKIECNIVTFWKLANFCFDLKISFHPLKSTFVEVC